jgi:hypothetical protein
VQALLCGTLLAPRQPHRGRRAARATFADALAQVRRAIWRQLGFCLCNVVEEKQKPAHVLFEHFGELLAYIT